MRSGQKIRTIWFLLAMMPAVLVLGLLSWILVIVTAPVTIVGMLAHKIADWRSRPMRIKV
ncbi:MAG: hypothetical protein QG577_2502 [Thermodesulfobacteriota bacterium]|nr:hypothetical protein [Thermodesulfobacteriota bacterium]